MEQKRIREYGYRVGHRENGPKNKITDVPGVRVGHATVDQGKRKQRRAESDMREWGGFSAAPAVHFAANGKDAGERCREEKTLSGER